MVNRISSHATRVAAAALAFALAGGFAAAQVTPPGKPGFGGIGQTERKTFAWANETPEERRLRLGTQEDPGTDPNPNTKWIRFGREYTIEKFEKRFAAFDVREGWVRPLANVNIPFEIYQETEQYVWAWMPVRQPREPKPETAPQRSFANSEVAAEYQKWVSHARPEFEPLAPRDAGVTIRFEESSNGLPQVGSWRNSLDVGDFNKDGHVDIVAPAQRGAVYSAASIFLGDGKGNWRLWKEARTPPVQSYGSIVAADLNKDGHLDLVYGVHLAGLVAQLGHGDGTFTDSSKGLPSDFPTRRAIVSDVDRDGDLDIVALTEGPTPGGGVVNTRLRAYLNNGKATEWTEVLVSEPDREVSGDYLAAMNFNGDRYPDFVGSSISLSGTDLFYLSGKKPLTWTANGRGFLPFFSLYYSLTTGKFSKMKTDEAVLSFVRYWPEARVDTAVTPHPKIRAVSGIERVWWDGKGLQRKPIARWDSRKVAGGLASGDFNGDGNLDLVYSTIQPREFVVLLGSGKGNFSRAKIEGIMVQPQTSYDLKVADVNRDGVDDVIAMYEADEGVKNGRIQVFLGRGASASEAEK